MPWATVAPEIVSLVESVSGIDRVILGDKRFRSGENAKSWLMTPGRTALTPCFVTRIGVSEAWWCAGRTKAKERYLIRLYRGIVAEEGSETALQAILDELWAVFRNVTTIGPALVSECAKTGTIGYLGLEFVDCTVNCHFAAILIETEEIYTVTVGTPLSIVTAAADERAGYADVAEQIAELLEGIGDEIGAVHQDRPWIGDQADVRSAFYVDSGNQDGHEVLRAWKIYRTSDAETRGIAQKVGARSQWKLAPAYAWFEEGDSYNEFQIALDGVRTEVRNHGNLGNPTNPTLAISSPLQIGDVAVRSIHGELCHWADCSIEIEEHVYAEVG